MGLLSIVRSITNIEMGSIWAAPNSIWSNGFARNKSGEGYHPAIVERVKKDTITAVITPGTSKAYKIGSCVFKIRLSPLSKRSHFLLKLSMPYLVEELEMLQNNWNGVGKLSEKQIKDFQRQITWCKGTVNN
jgi:hypothetical protein